MFTGSGGCSRGARRRLEPYFLSALVAPLVAERVLHPSWLRLQIPTALTLGVDDRIWPLQALDCARVARMAGGGVDAAASPVHEHEHLDDGEVPRHDGSMSQVLQRVETSQQWRERRICAIFSDLQWEIGRDCTV